MNGEVQVVPVRTSKEREAFIRFPFLLYREDPHWVPPLILERRDFLNPKKNPVFEFADVQPFIAVRDGQVVGTIAAVRNDRYCQFHPEDAHVGFFGLYESVPEQTVADALFSAASVWMKNEGKTVLRGPVNLTTNDTVGLLVEGFQDDPAVMMPYNPPYYAAQMELAGFVKAKDLFAYYLSGEEYNGRLGTITARLAAKQRCKLRPIDLGNWNAELAFVRECYNRAWTNNWGFTPWTDRELAFIAKELKPLVDPRLAFIGEVEGIPAGFIISIPDANQALKLAKGKLLPFGLLRILWKLKVRKCSRLRTLVMGVLPEHRRRGLDALMINQTIINGPGMGYSGSEVGWILEDNQALLSPLLQMGARCTKRYRIYDRAL